MAAALLPGSRKSEIRRLYPVLSGLYDRLEAIGVKPVFSVAPGLSGTAREFLLNGLARSGQRYYEGRGRDIMGASDVVAGSSGTATVEALLSRRDMAVMYKVSPLTFALGYFPLRRQRFAAPNVLAGDYFFPELIQGRATPENAFEVVRGLLEMSGAEREARDARREEIIRKLGRPGAREFWADEVMKSLA